MPIKKDLAALQSQASQPPLRRGRGWRLSRESKPAREPSVEAGAKPKFPIKAAERAVEAAESTGSPGEPLAMASESIAEAAPMPHAPAPADSESSAPARKKRKIQLRKDLLKECKRIARVQDRKLYQVIESALEEYIQRHGARE